jgi:hypothetical protein
MRSYFNWLPSLLVFISCGKKINETQEFIRLERQLATTCIQIDSTYFTNRHMSVFDEERQAQYTDSIMHISNAYDSLVFMIEKSSYLSEMDLIKSKLSRRIKFNPHNWKRNHRIDTTLKINDSLNIEFVKSSERIHLSNIFHLLSPGFQFGCIYYTPRKHQPFYIYTKTEKTIVGQINIGQRIFDDYQSKLQFIKENVSIKPLVYQKDSFSTNAVYLPIDTGMHRIVLSHPIYDPITGEKGVIKREKIIYVKPTK